MTDQEICAFLEQLERDKGASLQANERVRLVGNRNCVICGGRMRHEFHDGVEVDVCDEHGIWLDRGELAAIIRHHVAQGRTSKDLLIEHLKNQLSKERTIGSLFQAALLIT